MTQKTGADHARNYRNREKAKVARMREALERIAMDGRGWVQAVAANVLGEL